LFAGFCYTLSIMKNKLEQAEIKLGAIQVNGKGRADVNISLLLRSDEQCNQALEWLQANRSEIKLTNGRTALINWTKVQVIQDASHGWGIGRPLYTAAFGQWNY